MEKSFRIRDQLLKQTLLKTQTSRRAKQQKYVRIYAKSPNYYLKIFELQRRKLGDDAVDGPEAIENAPIDGALANVSGGLIRAIVSRPDGLVKEVKTKTVVSREEIDERLETEDVKILGDFSDEVSVSSFLLTQIRNKTNNQVPIRVHYKTWKN